jgi:hypothetical protein
VDLKIDRDLEGAKDQVENGEEKEEKDCAARDQINEIVTRLPRMGNTLAPAPLQILGFSPEGASAFRRVQLSRGCFPQSTYRKLVWRLFTLYAMCFVQRIRGRKPGGTLR